MDFRQTALDNRHRLLVSLSYLNRQAGTGAAGTVSEITRKAIAWGYVPERNTPTGELMGTWVRRRAIPAWAAKAAARLLLQLTEYKPNTLEETAALALMLAEGFPEADDQTLRSQIPDHLRSFLVDDVISKAIHVRKIHAG
jgi:hypothetical protein